MHFHLFSDRDEFIAGFQLLTEKTKRAWNKGVHASRGAQQTSTLCHVGEINQSMAEKKKNVKRSSERDGNLPVFGLALSK